MKRILTLSLVLVLGFLNTVSGQEIQSMSIEIDGDPFAFRELPVKEYRDKMKAGWIGQIAGVSWGAPTEFKFNGEIIPEDKMPLWKPEMINNAFGQDDLYVEMTFLRSMEEHGLNVSMRQAGIDFANSKYRLWHANDAGRKNLRNGIAPPDSGHPKFNVHADDIDYQIEADFSGLIAPGLPNVVIGLGDKFGRLMNYGDGVYAGQFVGGMYAEAFFETDIKKIIAAGLACIPQDSQYAEMVRDVVRWFDENPNDWTATWNKIEEKYQNNKDYRRLACSHGKFNIDAKINGAYILVGMLYGKGDLDQTIVLSTRCGQDSDCNPSNAGGVLFTTLGFSKLPARFSEKLNEKEKFSYTAYDFPALVDVCEKLARQAIVKEGGEIVKNTAGEEVFRIPVRKAKPGPYEPCWKPGPVADSKFSDAEKAKITEEEPTPEKAVAKLFPGWTLTDCGPDMDPGFRAEYYGQKNVLVTHPKTKEIPCVLSKTVTFPAHSKPILRFSVAAHEPSQKKYDWDLIVKVDGKEIFRKLIVGGPWHDYAIGMSPFAGKTVKIELLNQANGWQFEAGYWSDIKIE